MDQYALAHDKTVRFFCFLGVFVLMSLWEWMASRREQKISRNLRWPNNLSLTLLNALLIRLVFPGASLWAANWAFSHRFGLFNWIGVPVSFAVIFTIICLDWTIYYLHRTFHAIPWFWKFHRVHHSDLGVDVTTGIRFHPLEMVVSLLIKSAVILFLGPPVFSVFLFEVILNAVSLFNHANIKLPGELDKWLRFLMVTPDMHLVHHSANPRETNSNFGFIFSWWDRVFGTYRFQPEAGPEKIRIGLDVFDEPKYLRTDRLLLLPFLDKTGHFALLNFFHKV